MASLAAGISRLTTHRQTHSTDSGRIVDSPSAALSAMASPSSTQDDILLYDPPKKHHHQQQQEEERRRSRSWLSSTRRARSSTPVMARNGQPIHRISSPLTPAVQSGLTIHSSSSTSSLCSCHGEKVEVREVSIEKEKEKEKKKKSVSIRETPSPRCASPAPSGQPPKRPARPKHGLYEDGFDDEQVSPQTSPRQSSHVLAGPTSTDKEPVLEVADDYQHKQVGQLPTGQLHRHHDQDELQHHRQDSWSEDVQQLIHEADQAFKAVGSAFIGTKLSSYTFGQQHDTSTLSATPATPAAPTTPSPLSPTMSIPRRHSRSKSTSSDTAKGQHHNRPTPLRRPSDSGKASVTKPQRKKKKNKQQKPLIATAVGAGGKHGRAATTTWPGRWAGKGVRWTLSENVADILSGQRFKKIVADEMLTPTRIEELRRHREAKLEEAGPGGSPSASPSPAGPRAASPAASLGASLGASSAVVATASGRGSTESTRSSATGSTETPVEPFHLENLALRIGAAGVSASATASATPATPATTTPVPMSASPIAPTSAPSTPLKHPTKDTSKDNLKDTLKDQRHSLTPPPMMFDPDVVRSDFSLQAELSKAEESNNSAEEDDEALTPVDTLGFPLPPLRNPARNTFRDQKRRLPTIPEVLAPSTDVSRRASVSAPPTSRRSHDSDSSGRSTDSQYSLNSKPYILTPPTLHHGFVAFQRSDDQPHKTGDRKHEPEPDETLDWTSFQMAILGGAGEFEAGMEEEEERTMVDDVTAWFEEFGFESHGKLVPAHLGVRRASRGVGFAAAVKDSEMMIPVSCESPRQHSRSRSHSHQRPHDNHQQQTPSNTPLPLNVNIPAPLDTTKFLRSKGLRQWTPEGGYTKRSVIGRQPALRERRATTYTSATGMAAPSVVGGGEAVDVDEEAVDGMGCNLEHDLGAFLKWGADHTYGGTS